MVMAFMKTFMFLSVTNAYSDIRAVDLDINSLRLVIRYLDTTSSCHVNSRILDTRYSQTALRNAMVMRLERRNSAKFGTENGSGALSRETRRHRHICFQNCQLAFVKEAHCKTEIL